MDQPLFGYAIDQDGEDVCLALTGDLDLAVVGRLEAALGEAAALHAQTLTVNVSGVGFIDTSSISLLVHACNRVRAEGCGFSVVDSRGLVLRVLRTMGLADYFAQPPETAGTETS
jgi:anti-anti-sigma factor